MSRVLTEQEFIGKNKIGIYHTTKPIQGYKTIQCLLIENDYKKYITALVELEIPTNSKIIRATSYDEFGDPVSAANTEVRTNQAYVKNIIPSQNYIECHSLYDKDFKYHVNTMIYPKDNYFNKNESTQEGAGIHFFVDRPDAERYKESYTRTLPKPVYIGEPFYEVPDYN